MAMSEFGKAFRDARKAGDKTFMFKGKKYTTETKEEKDARMAKAAPAPAKKKLDFKPENLELAEAKNRAKKEVEVKPPTAKEMKEKPKNPDSGVRMLGASRFSGNRARRLDMEEADRKSRGDKYGMGMKKGGKVKKSRDGMASKGKTKGRMC